MAISILSGASNSIATVDPVSTALRVTLYDSSGNLMSSESSLNNVLNGLDAAVTVILGGQSTVGFNVSGTTGSLTLSFEGSIDDVTWVAFPVTPLTGGAAVSTTTTNGQWIVSSAGLYAVRARVSVFTSGAMTVSAVATPGASTIAGTAVSGIVTASQGTAAALSGAWPSEITDGTHGPVAVKAASTAAVATDPALVVAISPNNTIATSNLSVGPTGSAPPADGTLVAGYDGTNLTALKLKPASTAAVAADPSLVTALSPNSPLPAGSNALGSVNVTGTTAISAAALPLPTGAATSANQTTLGTQTTEINDGTRTATIKAASTAAAAADTSLVVGLSPNSPLPAGSNALGSVTVTGTTAVSGTVTGNQGTANTLANAWPSEITDGTHGPVAVKAASTAAVATDPALVVAISPNNTIATSNLSVGPTGSPPPADGTLVAGYDGTNLTALKLKPASTAAVATDPSLVTAFSPNSPLPTGANVIGAVTQSAGPWSVTAAQSTAANLNATVVQGAGSGAAGTYWYVRVTDGTNAMPTMDVVARKGFQAITDGTNGPVAVKAASTAAVATDPAFVVAVSPNNSVAITAAALPLPAGAATSANQTTLGSQTTKINDGTNTGTIKAASTAAVATDTALVVAISPNNPITASSADVVASGALGAANATVSVTHPGLASMGFQLATGTFVGTIVPEVSLDGGTTWNPTFFLDPTTAVASTSLVFAASNTATDKTIVPAGGAGQTRVRVSAYTSGTATATVRASDAQGPDPVVGLGVAGTPVGGVVSVQGVAGGQTLPVTAAQATAANLNATVTQGPGNTLANAWAAKITDATNGPVAVKAASTAAVATDPALVVAISPNNTIATSNLSVGPTGSPPPADGTLVAGYDGTNLTALKLKPASTAAVAADPSLVTALSPNSPLPAGSNALGSVTVTGTTAISAAALPLPTGAATSANQTTLGSQTTKINDGTNTAAVKAASTAAVAADPSLVVGLSPNSPLPAGTNALGSVTVTGTPAISGTVTANQGTPNTTANSWPTTVTDGTHGPTAVKAASTAAVATDQALVVAVSPNNSVAITAAALPLPAGAATAANQTTLGAQTTELNDGTRTATIKAASTAAVAADTSLVVAVSPNSPLPTGANTIGAVNQGTNPWTVQGDAASGSAVAGNPVLMGGSDGTNARTLATDTLGLAMTGDFAYAAAIARIPGALAVNIFSFNATANNGQLMATPYTEQGTAAIRSLSSSSANDTAAGTGAQQVTILGYDASMNLLTETVSLNGVTAVATTNSYRFIESLVVSRAGTSGVNVGTITLFVNNTGGGGTVWTIGVGNQVAGVGDNQAFGGHHYIRTGKSLYLLGMSWNFPTVSTGSVYLRYVNPLATGPAEVQKSAQFGGRYNTGAYAFRVPIILAGPARVRLYTQAVGGVEISASFEGVEF